MVKDHLGNEFKTKKEMCEYWDKTDHQVKDRLNSDWELKDALTIPISHHRKGCYHKWTIEEIQILKEKYPNHGSNIPELSHKKRKAILNKARKLGLRHINKWTKEEVKILKEKYPTYGSDIPELAHRDKINICAKANKLNILYGTSFYHWTDEEIEILKEEYPINGSKINKLAHISKKSIRAKAEKLGIKNNATLRKLGRKEMFNCGLKATIIESVNNKLVNIKFDDGEIKNNVLYSNFLNRIAGHPKIKFQGWFEYKGFKAKRLLVTDAETLYTCECQKCKELFPNEKNKYRFVMNPYQMIEHEKEHQNK